MEPSHALRASVHVFLDSQEETLNLGNSPAKAPHPPLITVECFLADFFFP